MRMTGYVSQFLKSVCKSAGDRALMTSLERDEQGELMELWTKESLRLSPIRACIKGFPFKMRAEPVCPSVGAFKRASY